MRPKATAGNQTMTVQNFHQVGLQGEGTKARGVAAVEFAVCLPALIVMVLGSIECCTMIFVRQSLSVAAHEGLRVAVRPSATSADVTTRCNQVFTERKLQGASFQIAPNNFWAQPPGTPLTITVTAPCIPNQILPLRYFSDSLTAQLVMVKE